eukprot:c19959_g1_i1 orf=517-1914(-)
MDSEQGKIFVGGISWETSEEKLKEHFSSFGSVVDTVIVKDRATGLARGFGFVAFADPAVVDSVLVEKHIIDGRVVEVKRAVPRDEQQSLPRSNSGGPVSGNSSRTSKIFVGGLASTVTEEDFKNYFSQFGNITDVVVMYDPDTRRPRGFGFITFDSEDAVEIVLQENTFHEIHDKLVEVKKAVPRENSAGRTGRGGFGAGRGGGSYNSGYGQGNNSSSGGAYNGPRYTSPSSGRGGFASHGPASYGTSAYGGAPAYSMPMNGAAYGAYGGGAGYPPAGAYGAGYGNTLPATAYGGPAGYGVSMAPSGGYGSAQPAGQRSPWGTGTAFAGGGSPAYYGAGGAGYPASGWNAGGAPQTNGGNAGYNSKGYGYGTLDASHNSNVGGHAARGMAAGPGGYGDSYTGGAQNGDTAWKPSEYHSSPATATGTGYAGSMGNGPAIDGTGNGFAGRQTQRGPDTRFRPYPTTG